MKKEMDCRDFFVADRGEMKFDINPCSEIAITIDPESIKKQDLEEESEENTSDIDEVNEPNHYQSSSGLECYEAIEAAVEDLQGVEAVYTGNIIKYAWRWNKKGTPIKDLKKIIKYCNMLIEHLEDE